MSIRFNKLNNNLGEYNFAIDSKKSPEEEVKKAKASEQVQKSDIQFKGLKNEEDLLTKNIQNLYGINIARHAKEDRDIEKATNEILAQLGCSYKVTASQVASVSNNVKNVVLPGLKGVEDATVAAHIMDPNGPFAELFS